MPTSLLIIDDDEDDRLLFCEAASDLNMDLHCETCEGGEDAFKLLKACKGELPDFIFLDLNMPRMSGKQCLAKLKSNKAYKHSPVVIYSTARMDRDVIELKELGATAFITKPSRQKDLMNAITMVINEEWEQVEATINGRR